METIFENDHFTVIRSSYNYGFNGQVRNTYYLRLRGSNRTVTYCGSENAWQKSYKGSAEVFIQRAVARRLKAIAKHKQYYQNALNALNLEEERLVGGIQA